MMHVETIKIPLKRLTKLQFIWKVKFLSKVVMEKISVFVLKKKFKNTLSDLEEIIYSIYVKTEF